jgi:hypothetical protein
LPLDQLARELHVHLRTLQAAARTGRLDAHFSVRSAFGRPIRYASRAAGDQFIARTIGASAGRTCALLLCRPFLTIMMSTDELRRRMRLTQDALARIGAAGKAVVYQWESRKRTPSPVLWARVEALGRARMDGRRTPISSKGPAHFFTSPPNGRYEQPRPNATGRTYPRNAGSADREIERR